MRRKAANGVRAEPLELGYAGGRLASATAGGKSRLAFGYDEQGNVSAVSAYNASGAAIERTVCLVHDALGRLVAAGYAAPGAGGADALACRSEAELAEVIATFRYDAWNRRVARQEGSGAWTVWAYDGEGRPLSEVAPSGTSWTAGRDYVFLEGQPLAQVEYPGPAGGEGYRYYLHTDHLGLPRAMTSGSGQVVWSAAAIPNGELQETVTPDAASGQTVATNLRLPGQYDERLLGSLGLQGPYYSWNRWYLPSLGRYLELDPIAVAGGFNGELGLDWYGYAIGNPLRRTDPWGLDATDESNWANGCRIPLLSAPTNGMWCGDYWSGGNGTCRGKGHSPPTDSLDLACMKHDLCYTECSGHKNSKLGQACVSMCNRAFVTELRCLGPDPSKWLGPPRPGTEADSLTYRDKALWYFGCPPQDRNTCPVK